MKQASNTPQDYQIMTLSCLAIYLTAPSLSAELENCTKIQNMRHAFGYTMIFISESGIGSL